MTPEPLPADYLLSDRYLLQRVLGSGGFGIAYLAEDLVRSDRVVVKELAPQGGRRKGTILDLDGVDESAADRLRHRFLEEAKTIGRLNVPGVLPIRDWFVDNGTAYYVTQYLTGSETLEQLLQRDGRLSSDGALDLFMQLLETLEAIHERGILHRDIKPSNILVTQEGHAVLIDFGSAREWHTDSNLTQTVQFTPGYAPPEQLSERAKRGPATDIYGLCATLYHMLAGRAPESAADRLNGVELTPIRLFRRDIDWTVVEALEGGLRLVYGERPQTGQELRNLISRPLDSSGPSRLSVLDEKLFKLNRFSFERRACPSCGDVLAEPKPLRRGQCPVCRAGLIRMRRIEPRLCPVCRAGALRKNQNSDPLFICPVCSKGRLSYRRKSILSTDRLASCSDCSTQFDVDDAGLSVVATGEKRTSEEWRARSGRSSEILACAACTAQFDLQQDRRWKQVLPVATGYTTLYADEWARVAAHLDPSAGNAECDGCGADYFLEDEHLTLLDSRQIHNAFTSCYAGRRLHMEAVRWLGVGKQSPRPGYVCESCQTELDKEGDYLRIADSTNRRFARHLGEPRKLEDWHRIAQGLPTVDEEENFRDSVHEALLEAYEQAEIGFDNENTVLWRGPASKAEEKGHGTLTVSVSEVAFGGLLRKWRAPLEAIVRAEGDNDLLTLQLSGERDSLDLVVEPVELTAHLRSGNQSVLLSAPNLSRRIAKQLGRS